MSSLPAPTVTGITPNSGLNTGKVSETITGTGFLANPSVMLRKSGQTDISATSVAVVSSTKITCTFDLTGAATGQMNVVVQNTDGQSGTLTSGFTVTRPALTNVSVTPSSATSATGAARTFAATHSDSGGWQNLTYAQLWVTANGSLADGLSAEYHAVDNTLWLSDANGQYGGYAPGSSNVITTPTGRGSLDCSKTTVSGSGSNLTINFNLIPNATMGGKTFAVKLWYQDKSGTTTDYDNLGTWTVNVSPSASSASAGRMPTSSGGSVDVALTRLTVTPNPASRNDSSYGSFGLTLSFTVKNLGETALKDLKFVVMENGKLITKSVALPALAKGEEYTGSLHIQIPSSVSIGDHLLTGVVSTASAETNTDNNKQTVKITVK